MRLHIATALWVGAGLTLASAADAAVPFAGRTDQASGLHGTQRLPSNAVRFSLRQGSVVGLSVPWVATCRSAEDEAIEEPLLDRVVITDPLPVRAGSFSAEGHYMFPPGVRQEADVVQFVVRGTIAGSRATGTIRVTSTVILDGQHIDPVCKTARPIRWSARAGAAHTAVRAPRRARPLGRRKGVIVYERATPGQPTVLGWTIPGSNKLNLGPKPPAGASDTAPAMPIIPSPLIFERTAGTTPQLYSGIYEGPLLESRFPDGRITDFSAGARQPAVSSRLLLRRLVAFTVGSGADCSLWQIDDVGRNRRRLTDHGGRPGCDDMPTWAPDGRRLAFRRTLTEADGTPVSVEYLVLPPGGGTPRAIPFGPVAPSGFSWAPGRKLAFVVPGAEGQDATLEVMNADGSGRRTVLRSPSLTGRPAWSPINDRIAVVLRAEDGSTDLGVVESLGGPVAALTATPGVSEQAPVWSYPLIGFGGGEPGPGVHIRSKSTRPHRKRKPANTG